MWMVGLKGVTPVFDGLMPVHDASWYDLTIPPRTLASNLENRTAI